MSQDEYPATDPATDPATGPARYPTTPVTTSTLVPARSAFPHSVDYRCVVAPGTAAAIADEHAEQAALTALVDAVVLRLPLSEVSLKVRQGPPGDGPADVDLPHRAGVLPLTGLTAGPPQDAPDLPAGVPVPEHVSGWGRSTPAR